MKRILLFVALVLLAGCAQSVDTVKTDDYVGQKVTVQGEVTSRISIGPLSGYTLEDDTGRIGVASDALPAEGDTARVTGTLMKDTIFGYYIRAE